MNSKAYGRLVSGEFEEIRAGRRLVLEYPISSCMRMVAVVLDSASKLDDELAIECAAMLVPCGKESDWVYCWEGGQWQLLASAGVKRLILLSRICNAHEEEFKMGAVRNRSEEENGDRAPKRLRLVKHCTCPLGQTDGEQRKAGDNALDLERKREYIEAECSKSLQEKRGLKGKSRSAPRMERRKPKYKQDKLCQKKQFCGSNESRDRNSRRIKQKQLPHLAIDCTDRPLMSNTRNVEDEALKRTLRPLILALAPKVSFKTGVPNIPFVNYADKVLQRVVVEEVFSALTGLMRVEDVELETDDNETDELVHPIQEMGSRRAPDLEQSSPHVPLCTSKVKSCTSYWRRRLIFRRMPNLIQTEVLLSLTVAGDDSRRNLDKCVNSDKNGLKKLKKSRNACQAQLHPFSPEAVVRREVDHSRLVHKYLPPIVAGFVLVALRLDACFASEVRRARVLSIGVGGGALPIFLRKHFMFHIQVVDLDEEVLKLAKKYFGLTEDVHFQVTVNDGVAVVEKIAARAIEEGVVDEELKKSWTVCISDSGCARNSYISKGDHIEDILDDCLKLRSSHDSKKYSAFLNHTPNQIQVSSTEPHFYTHEQFHNDPRVELIIVDVDVGDAQMGLSSPPLSFLEQRFLLSAKVALQQGGMLAINVVPSGDKPYESVINSLKAVFTEVYEIALEDDVNRIVFALPVGVGSHDHVAKGHTVELVKTLVGDRLVRRIRRLKGSS